MRLTIVQTSLEWESPDTNRSNIEEILAPLEGQTDLVVLPEMFTTGFSMNAAALAEPTEGPTLAWMQDQAARLNTAICGSIICKENENYFNRDLFVKPDGNYTRYDKKHLFSLAEEHKFFTPGSEKVFVDWKGFRIRPLICYDLRFPEWARQEKDNRYDLLLYSANWPRPRALHWQSLLSARAIENQCFLAGVNIVGKDGNGLEYQGDSAIISYAGDVLCRLTENSGVYTTKLALEPMKAFRERLDFLSDM